LSRDKHTEEQVKQRDQELRITTSSREKVKIALKMVMKHRNNGKCNLEERFRSPGLEVKCCKKELTPGTKKNIYGLTLYTCTGAIRLNREAGVRPARPQAL
jgi:hypothetical protein